MIKILATSLSVNLQDFFPLVNSDNLKNSTCARAHMDAAKTQWKKAFDSKGANEQTDKSP